MTQPKPQAILVVDDDDALRKLLIDYLTGHGLSVSGVGTATEAVKAVASNAYSLVLLDLSLPDGDGIDLARKWRAEQPISIICLTGRLEEADRVMGLELGADDYITKPFSLREVLARIRAVTRRASGAASNPDAQAPSLPPNSSVQVPVTRGKHPRAYRFALWALNLNTRRLTSPEGKPVSLTNAEFNLLAVFLGTPGRIISREQLLERTRAFDDIYDRAIDVQILRLRRKLEADAKNPKLLCTERGVGYFLNAEVEALWE
ncbi:DNA-binding response regulator, OmpR family, contains REC and winged-helix (wHTH) domain [Polaromonas sp. YR568]|uniref:response regulator n=1 Tax=Polaromonas sp. YR568 TaxID=1855301 RepID=UPI0008EF22C3|nr:response regulator [Polaromonas sp. YR568]SFU61246.1 DNA-binding response regulator, OmpR family, contains REC and winged-helix (wHTH) domain [Polaromonas sp. YR568]